MAHLFDGLEFPANYTQRLMFWGGQRFIVCTQLEDIHEVHAWQEGAGLYLRPHPFPADTGRYSRIRPEALQRIV